jgi:hypothetical protein
MRRFVRGNVEPPRCSGKNFAISIHNVRITVGQRHGKIRVQVRGELAGKEVFIPNIIGIEETHERRAQLLEATPNGSRLPMIAIEPDIPKAAVAKPRQDSADDGIRLIRGCVIDNDDFNVSNGLARNRFYGVANESLVIVIANDHPDMGN